MSETMTQTVQMPMSSTGGARPAHAGRLLQRVLRETGYNLSAFLLAVPAFVLAVTGLAVGLGTLVLVVGVPLLALTAYVARGFAHVERLRVRSLLGRPAPTPVYLSVDPRAGLLSRVTTPLRDPQSWLDVVWSVVGLVTGTIAFAVTVGWYAGAAGGLTYWWWQRYIDFGAQSETLAQILGFGSGRGPESVLNLVLGLLALVTLPAVVRLASLLHGSTATVVLSSRAELQHEVSRAQAGRATARVAEASSLRRLERDIHDGPQQRLVRLSMDIGRARRQLDTDPAAAREILDGALRQTQDTVAELRSLSRGIAPPVLVDRGLVAALDEVVNRSPVPVHSSVRLAGDLPPHVETTVYFVVSEALTNVAKHAGAGRVDVLVSDAEQPGEVVVRVTDDGHGGAHPSKGLGLAGLDQRVRATDGTLTVGSPPGGPTVVEAVVPCA
jgi:signal transduction histidine kinase